MSQNSPMTIDDYKVIYRSSPLSGIAVAEDGTRRNLYMNGDILQSTMQLNDPTGLYLEYSQAMMSALFFQPEPENVLLVGLGGGTLVKFLLEFFPGTRVDVAEINDEIVQVARDYFLLPETDRLTITHAPGEQVVADRLAAGESYNLILLDAFDDNGPARALLEEDFLRQCQELLTQKGVFVMNLWNRPVDDFPAKLDFLAGLFNHRIQKLLLADCNSNAIVFGFNEPLPVKNLMKLKPLSRQLGRRTGINFLRWLRQMHWQNL